jgi:hypothetical protein
MVRPDAAAVDGATNDRLHQDVLGGALDIQDVIHLDLFAAVGGGPNALADLETQKKTLGHGNSGV